jgi:hypothetical protein
VHATESHIQGHVQLQKTPETASTTIPSKRKKDNSNVPLGPGMNYGVSFTF